MSAKQVAMHANPLIPPDAIVLDLELADTSALLELLARRTAELAGIDVREVLAGLEGTPGQSRPRDSAPVLHGIACFRVFSEKLDRVVGLFALLKHPIPNDLGGSETIEAAFVFVGPASKRNAIIKLRAAADLLAESRDARKRLRREHDPQDLSAFLEEWLVGHESDLYARDVMRPPYIYLTTDTPLRSVVHEMLRYGVESIGIVDADRRLVGEITSDRLFQMGMPDFFSQLKSVAFLGEFDPFEKYFEKEGELTAASVMSTEYAAVDDSTPIIEIIFHLAVERRWKVYVVREGELVGVIDRLRVLETVINS